MTEEITTQRLTLNALSQTDVKPIADMIGDPDVSRWLTSVPHPYTPEDAVEFIERVRAGGWNAFAIRASKTFMGVITIREQLGYWLGKPFWRQGYMGEAARGIVDWHFRKGAADLTSGYLLGNAGSARILSSLGFRPTDIIESYVPTLGQQVANQQMLLTRADWEACT